VGENLGSLFARCSPHIDDPENETAAPTAIGNGGKAKEAWKLREGHFSTRTGWVNLADSAAMLRIREKIGGAA
jgi:hypothetical protein